MSGVNLPRTSIFRDALQVSPERIANLSDADLNELMRDLLRAEAHRCKSPLSQVCVNTEGAAKDDGCDGWTVAPAIDDDWLGNADTCWQIKAGTAGQAQKLEDKHEVRKRIPKDTLSAGGRFVLVASGSTSGVKGERDRLEALVRDANADGIPTGNIVVIGSERLTEWCNQHPAVAARWAGRPSGLWTFSDWAISEPHRGAWHASPAVAAELAAQRAALDFETGSVQHLHIHGQPGVGKTRFALELCREAAWQSSVIYLRQATEIRLSELLDSVAQEQGVRLFVVADEVQPEQLMTLRDSVGRANGRVRLITIGHSKTPDPARIPALAVSPLEPNMLTAVVKGWHSAMPTEHVDFVVRFADGYVRLAKLAADAVLMGAAINVHGLLTRNEIRVFFDRMLGSGDRRALYVVAVLQTVGWSDDKRAEGEAVAKHLDLKWNEVRAQVDDFNRRFGIAPQGGRYRYISPTPLGNHLAVEAWSTYPDLLRTLVDKLPSDTAKEAYYARIRSIASNPEAREYAREELDFFFRADNFVDPLSARRWSALSAADPEQAARNISRALADSSLEERAKIERQARREVVSTLVRLAWRPGAFADATKSLALLAEVENETWANNATAEFIAKFQLYLSGTALPFLDRLGLLDDLLDQNRIAITRLVIAALARVGDRQGFRLNTAPASDDLPEEEWQPTTVAELLACIEAALDRLSRIAERALPELQDPLVTTAKKNLAMMLRDTPVRPLVERFFDVTRAAYPDSREPLRRAIADVIHRERKYWKDLSQAELADLDALHARFEDSSLTARLRQHVGQAQYRREDQIDLRPLARELVEAPDALTEEWPWLTSGDAADAWRFGEALAQGDPQHTIAANAALLSTSGHDLRVLCGYISVLRGSLGDDWYDQWVATQLERARPTELLFQVAWRVGPSVVVAHHVARFLQTNDISAEIVGQLGFGKWGDSLEPEALEEVLHAMIDANHNATALTILENRLESVPAERRRWLPLALELVQTSELIRGSQMIGYYWKELAMRVVPEHPGEVAAAIAREQADRSAGTWFAEHSEATEVLLACVEQDPGAVWSALLPHLSTRVGTYMFGVGFPRGVIARIAPSRVFAWVNELPEERAAAIAKLAPKDLSSDETLAALILGAYGDRDDVAQAFFGEYLSGGWVGPASARWTELAMNAEEVAKRSKLPKLRSWATETARGFKEMAERDRQREEEEEIRRR